MHRRLTVCLLLITATAAVYGSPHRPGRPTCARRTFARLCIEKMPLLVLSAASCAVTIAAQSGQAMSGLGEVGLPARVANAVVSYGRYVLRTFWPADLAVLYPHPMRGGEPLTSWQVTASACALLAICAVVARLRRFRFIVVGWLWFLGTLVPVIGLVQVGLQGRADRYTYMPLTGLFILVVWGLHEWMARCGAPRRNLVLASTGIVLTA